MSRDYKIEKLTVALDILATSDAPVRDRIVDAYLDSFCRLREEDFTDADELEDYKFITSFFQTVANEQLGSARASAKAASDEDCKQIAERIVWLMFKVASDTD